MPQTMAFIKARNLIVDVSLELAHDAISKLTTKDIQLSDGEREDLTSDLLIVLCSDESAKSVLKVELDHW